MSSLSDKIYKTQPPIPYNNLNIIKVKDVKEFIKRLKDEIDVTHHKAGDMLDACLVNEEKKDVTYLLPYVELDTMIDKLAGEDLV